jgi:hypothetical protein
MFSPEVTDAPTRRARVMPSSPTTMSRSFPLIEPSS